MMVLMIFEFRVNRAALFFLRVVSKASCSNNQIVLMIEMLKQSYLETNVGLFYFILLERIAFYLLVAATAQLSLPKIGINC